MYVPYISPYDMGGKGKLKTIMMDPELFDNCPNYTKNHPYVHVFSNYIYLILNYSHMKKGSVLLIRILFH